MAIAVAVARASHCSQGFASPFKRQTSYGIRLEFDIPRLDRREDAVLVTGTDVVPIEFRVGAKTFQQIDYE